LQAERLHGRSLVRERGLETLSRRELGALQTHLLGREAGLQPGLLIGKAGLQTQLCIR
jgi:hypothetical protein